MTLSHYKSDGMIGLEVIVDYNKDTKQVEDVISIIATDVSDMAEVDIASLLYHKFPNIIKFLVDTVDWNKEYEEYLQHSQLKNK